MRSKSIVIVMVAGVAVGCGSGPATGTAQIELHYLEDNGAERLVAFEGADGRLMSVVPADASGVAAAEIEEGGMITVQTSSGHGAPHTFTGVQVGDHLRYDEADEGNAGGLVRGTLRVQVPGPYAGATVLGVAIGRGGCGASVVDPQAPVDVEVTDQCVNPDGTVDVIASALVPTPIDQPARIAYSVRPGLAWQSGDAVVLDPWHAPTPLAVTVPGTYPDGRLTIQVNLTVAGRRLVSARAVATAEADRVIGRLEAPAGIGDQQLTTVQWDVMDGTSWHGRLIQRGGDFGSVTFAAADIPPTIDFEVADVGSARPTFTWSVDGLASAGMAEPWFDDTDGHMVWSLTVAPDQDHVQLPEVPASMAPAAAPAHAGVVTLARAGASWDDLRTTWSAPWTAANRDGEVATWVGRNL